jgi:hypothetical protein
VLLGALAVMLAADGAWLWSESSSTSRADGFQLATGGLGLGAAVSGAWSYRAFDARLESTCESELWPIPGLWCANPYHGASVVELPRMERVRR